MLHQKIAFKAILHTQAIYVHPRNRSGLGLSWHNVHRNGDKIFHAGASLDLLTNAYCFEMNPTPAERKAQEGFNLDLIKRSNGLLAGPTGHERHLSVGCGHTTAFCRAAAAKCPTKLTTIADDNGRIDCPRLCEDAEFSKMIQTGWEWIVIPWTIDHEFPELADIAQKALNASNHVASLVGEIEMAKSIADIMMDGTGGGWDAQALMAVESVGAPCSPYAKTILEYVRKYSGGEGAPILVFLDVVAKEFQCNATLGQTFWSAVTDSAFHCKTKQYPLIRCAMILCNLTSPKFEDGIAKLLQRGDMTKLCTKSMTEKVDAAETVLEQAMHITNVMQKSGKMARSEFGPLGRLYVRIALLLTGKEKDGREQINYTMAQIQKTYLDEMTTMAGTEVKFDKWSLGDVAAVQASTKVVEQSGEAAVSLQDHGNPVFLATEAGFSVGGFVFERAFGFRPAHLYKIESITSIVELTLACAYDDVTQKLTVETMSLVSEWSVYKNDPPYKMFQGEHHLQDSFDTDLARTKAFTALYAAGSDATHEQLAFYRRPDIFITTEAIPKGKLVLVPLTLFQSVITKKVASGFNLTVIDGIEMYAVAPSKPQQIKGSVEPFDCKNNLVAFWWVHSDTTVSESEANMHYLDKKLEGVKINCLTNYRVVPKYTRLRVLTEAPAAKNRLENVITHVKVDANVKSSGMPAKRGRKS